MTATASRQAGTDGLPLPRRYWAILAISLNTLMVVIDTSIIVVALPTAARALDVTKSEAVSLVAITQLIALIGMLPLAALGDRFGHTRQYRAGQMLYIIGALLCFFAPTLYTLLAARALQAIGSSAILSVGMVMLRGTYPSQSLGKGLGINGVLISLGAAIAPSLGGLVVATLGWRWVFLGPLPMVAGSLLLGWALPRVTPRHPDFDWRGALFYGASAALVAVSFSTIAYGGTLAMAAPLVVLALLVTVLFVRRERRIDRPILPVDLLARPLFALSIGAAFAAFAGSMTMLLSLPFLLEASLGQRPVLIGTVMMAWPAAMMVSAPIAGALADRLPSGSLSAFGMALACIGYASVAMVPADAGQFDFAWRIAFCGLGMGFFVSPNSRILIGSTPPARTASAGSLMSTTRILGQSAGAATVALLMQPALARAEAAPLIAAVLALAAGSLSLCHLLPALRRTGEVHKPVDHTFLEDDGL